MIISNCRRLMIVLMVIIVSLANGAQLIASDELPLEVLINERIQTPDSVVIVKKVVVYPNEESLYGPGDENYGMPVKEEYKKGPVVLLEIEKNPGHPWYAPFASDWIKLELFSDGKKLSATNSGEIGNNRMVFGFSFWAAVDMSVSPDGAIELEKLGELKLKVTISRITKVFDIPTHDISRGRDAIYEDEDLEILEVKWEEKWSKSGGDCFTQLRVRFNSKVDSAYYFLDFKGKRRFPSGGQYN